MTLSDFFEHWSIVEHPFRGEEARHDAVFARMTTTPGDPSRGPASRDASDTAVVRQGRPPDSAHSDFEKILGELHRPATAIVFGEKGSGKTAIRLQIERRVREHNALHPTNKVLLVPYDDLSGIIERFHARVGGKDPLASLEQIRLVDHIDAMLGLIVPRLVDAVLGRTRDDALDLGPEAGRLARRMDEAARRDLLLLQAIYDRPAEADLRTRALRRLLRLPAPKDALVWMALAWGGVLLPGAVVALYIARNQPQITQTWVIALIAAAAVWLALLAKRYLWDPARWRHLGRRVRRQIRVSQRPDVSYAMSLRRLHALLRDPANLPVTESDETRFLMLERLRRVAGEFGFVGMIVIVDRVDEPTLISGDPARMKAVVWPMLNNKFLQQAGIGFKLLLPIELRHTLYKESSAFFQEARLDKQNLIDRLSWTGPMLYDLCNARLRACLAPGAKSISLLDLFAEDVTRQDLVDALDQMHQPRDAFKFLYHCFSEHCSNVSRDQEAWRIPRLLLDSVRKQESERVQALYRGIRPA